MKKQFNHIIDISGNNKVFPLDYNSYALFFTQEEPRRFFIYALYTKKDLTVPELLEVDFDLYMTLRSQQVVENVVDNIDHLSELLFKMKRETLSENISVGQVLKLNTPSLK